MSDRVLLCRTIDQALYELLGSGVIYYSVRISERPSNKIFSIEMHVSLISIDCSFIPSITFGFNSISLL